MAEQFVRRAVKALAEYLEAQLPTHLAAVESSLGIDPGSLGRPPEVRQAYTPLANDDALYQVYANAFAPEDHRNGHYAVDCTILAGFVGDADLEANTARVDNHISAVMRCMIASRTLGGTVMQALVTDADRLVQEGDESAIRQAFAIGVLVRLQED